MGSQRIRHSAVYTSVHRCYHHHHSDTAWALTLHYPVHAPCNARFMVCSVQCPCSQQLQSPSSVLVRVESFPCGRGLQRADHSDGNIPHHARPTPGTAWDLWQPNMAGGPFGGRGP